MIQLDAAQKRIIHSKPFTCNLVKGDTLSGKTTVALYRTLYLENNYCLYEEDRILIVTKDKEHNESILNMYKGIKKENSVDYITLFSSEINKVDITPLKNIIDNKDKEQVNYTHIIIDEGDFLTETHIEILKTLLAKKSYSSMMITLNKNIKSLLSKSRKLNSLNLGLLWKNHNLKNSYINTAKVIDIGDKIMSKEPSFIENYNYKDIRHNRRYDFTIDTSNIGELVLNDNAGVETYKGEDLRQVPMYSDIAAGEPIYISDELESNFYIPEFWLKGMKDCFILKVKGSSMIGADINDGDFVVIRKQYSALNGDIVAADLEGNATLKRLSIKKEGIALMPENDRYSPIPIEDGNVSILGVAIGIIKKNNN